MMTGSEIVAGAVRLSSGGAVAFAVYQLVRRVPWPRPFRLRYAAVHILAAPLAAVLWYVIATSIQRLFLTSDISDRFFEFMFLGIVFYAIVAGVAHAVEASSRAARAEAIAARTQLAALRAQMHPHFLFNALHTVVQLIPIEPQRAAEAAELVGDLLRATLEETRDQVTLADEWKFVSRYLELERIRFGERLIVRDNLDSAVLDDCVPAFALQTLVENAVHHGAAPRVAATEISVTASGTSSALTLSVRNSGDGGPAQTKAGPGTGLSRLRERLAVLYGGAANLTSSPCPDGGFEAVLVVPRHPMREL
jgi:two-component system LytT family sensor kinase